MAKKIKLIVIVGPTASGKSGLGIKLAKKFNGEIISADSRQVYRGMDIGTGKVRRDRTFPVPKSKTKNQNAKFRNYFYSEKIRHHLIDVVSPKKQFTADDFKNLGQRTIDDIMSRNKVPIIVGGTGFYIDILLGRISIAEVPPNKKLRARFDKLTVEHLFKMLEKLDPRRAKTIERQNKRRLVRALEIVLTTGKPVPRFTFHVPSFKILWIGLKPVGLEKRIKRRLDARLRQGMINEVANLHKNGVSWKRLDDFGLEYRYVARYLRQNSKLEILNPTEIPGFAPEPYPTKQTQNSKFQIIKLKQSEYYENLLREIIKYSKRQMTWFKINRDIHWINPSVDVKKEAQKLAHNFVG